MVKGRVLKLYDSRAVFENLETGQCLVLSQVKTGGLVREVWAGDRNHVPELGVKRKQISIEGIFGIYDLLSGSFVAVVTESEPYVSHGEKLHIRRVKKISLIPLFQGGNVLSPSKKRDEETYLALLNESFLKHQFFYSSSFELTHTQQRIAKLGQHSSDPLWTRAEHSFFWNRELIYELINCQADDWIVPFMSGFIEFQPNVQVEDESVSLLFISRRSKFRQGCRFTKRGINEYGNVANFVETEQIVLFPSGRVTSYVQIRGSIPLFWASPVHMRYEPAVYISENKNKSVECCEKHFHDIQERYSDGSGQCDILLVNLIDNKKDQGRLGVAYKEVVDAVQEKYGGYSLNYVWFDFHHACAQKGKWENLSKLVRQVDSIFQAHGFFSAQANGVVTSFQSGVIRTNCMDNLDRTNVVQSLFARRSLLMQLNKNDLLLSGKVLSTPFKKFEDVYKSIWIHNADAISLMYAGTGALKVDFTKTGKRTIAGMCNDGMNSCMRYYLNNFTDGEKQDGIDLMLGNYKPYLQNASPFVARSDQDTIESQFLRAFVFLISLFSLLVMGSPLLDPLLFRDPAAWTLIDRMSRYFIIALIVALILVAYVMFLVVKKGSKIGERLVGRPRLCPE